MIVFTDKDGRKVGVSAKFMEETWGKDNNAEELLLSVLQKLPQQEFIELPRAD